jgi:hypothetical protein
MRSETIRAWRGRATLLAIGASCCVALGAAAEEPKPALEPVMQEQLATDAEAIRHQERVNQLGDETRELLLQYRQYLSETKSLREYSDQLAVQVQSQGGEIEFLQQQLSEIEDTARDVLPLMQKMLDTLDRFVELDVPFQLVERRKRVDSLKETMGRADVSISEKYRRIVEAYQIETEYGRTLEAYPGELEDARTVRFLRIGRVALLYQTMDGQETGYWDVERKGWVVDDSYRSAVKHGFEVADKVGAPDLLAAPIPAPVAAVNAEDRS